jgi:ribose 5-phosphate isomerase B
MIYLASDHAGFKLKEAIKKFLTDQGTPVTDCGNTTYDPDDDYVDFIVQASRKVAEHPDDDRAILFGGSGQGEAMAANKIKGVRAAVFYGSRKPVGSIDVSGHTSEDPYEIVRLAHAHNNANALSIGARFVGEEEAKEAITAWLTTLFTNEKRHARRIKKIDEEM